MKAIKRVVAVVLVAGLSFVSNAADFPAWGKKAAITFSGYTGTETLTNFPALVVLGSDTIGGFTYAECLEGGADLRFSDSLGTVELPYEIERWNPAGRSLVWVRVPELVDAGTSITAYWNRAGQTAPDYTTNGTVWANGYVAVYHLEGSPDPLLDSSPLLNPAAKYGNVQSGVIGVSGEAVTLSDGNNDWLQAPQRSELDGMGQITVQCWMYDAQNDDQPRGLLSKRSSANTQSWYLFKFTSRNLFMNIGSARAEFSNSATDANRWYGVAGTYDKSLPSGRMKLYLDGAFVDAKDAATGNVPVTSSSLHLGILNADYGYSWKGRLDEVRVSNVARSPDWIRSDYLTIASNTVFQSYGTALSGTPGLPAVLGGSATNIASSSAWLCGNLVSTGASVTAVIAYWGTTDGGTNAANWSNSAALAAPQLAGPFSIQATGLSADSTYYFRVAASNDAGVAWSFSGGNFITGELALTKTSDADEAALTPGVFTVTRPGTATNEALNVTYAQTGGTAVSGVDVAPLGGTVTIPAGDASAAIAVTPLKNYALMSDTTLELTLTDAQAVLGANIGAAMTIVNEGLPPAPTNAWVRSGVDPLASTAANWSLGYAPTNQNAIIFLGPYASAPDMTWDLTNAVAGWTQTAEYTGTVTVPASAAMLFKVNGDIELEAGNLVFVGDTTAIGGGSESVKHGLGYTIQAANLFVGTNATLNADGRGFPIRQGPGKGSTYIGASHGGIGGINALNYTQSPRYGTAEAPTALGSGGEDKAGGGALKIVVGGTVTVDGRLSADAPPGVNGGASGGSIWIVSGTLRGTGRISANGGTSSNVACHGGGGRVDISGTVNDFAGDLLANGYGGTGYKRGTTGSILLPESTGSGLTLDHFAPTRSIAFGNAVVFANTATIPSGVTVTLDANPDENSFGFDALVIENGGAVACLGNVLAVNEAAGGTSAIRYGEGVQITVTNLTIDAGGALHADNAGFGNGTGPGGSTSSTWGGSYGGRGGVSSYTGAFPLKPCYGGEYGPTALGSAGNGNVGGGAVKVTVAGTATVNGRLSASSTSQNQNASLGSGGSVWITGGTLAGTGVIAANGGYGGNTPTGGGGGRVDISGTTNDFTGSLQALGGKPNGTATGLAGSIVIPQNAGTGLTMDAFVLTNAIVFGNSLTFTSPVVVTNGGALTLEANPGNATHRFTTLTVANGGVVNCKSNWAATNAVAGGTGAKPYGEGIVIEAANVVVQAGGTLNANGGGGYWYGGPGYTSNASGYGGKSGRGYGNAYGTLFDVSAVGSGSGGYGGGALKLVVGDTLRVDGDVSADGALATYNHPAGSGGSLWIDCRTLGGAGTLSAQGGRAVNGDGGGGGRLFLVYDILDEINPVATGNVVAFGGYGWGSLDRKGGAGTVLIRPRTAPANSGTLIVKNDTVANLAVTPLPPDLPTTTGELGAVALRIEKHGRVSLNADLRVGDLYLVEGVASPATLDLNGHTLRVNSYPHGDWGDEAWVVYDGGQIVWRGGSLLTIR